MARSPDDVFRSAGRRSTPQRNLVLSALKRGGGHMDAEAVHDMVKKRDPRISLATVYRSLSVLRDMGMVEQHHLGEDHGHYEVARQGPHHHFACLGCGDVLEFDAPEVSIATRRLESLQGVKISAMQLSAVGLCARCAKENRQRSR